MKTNTLLVLLLLSAPQMWAQNSSFDYFGLERPGTDPQAFNPSVLEMEGSFIFNAMFTPDGQEFYYSKIDEKENMYCSKRVNGVWQAPSLAPFSVPEYHDVDPFFARGGDRIYFVSSRPIDAEDTNYDYNIWFADRVGKGWGTPQPLPAPFNTDHQEYFFSISDRGNAFFASNRPGGLGSFDIYQLSILEDGSLTDPVNFSAPVNTAGYEFDPYISPDEQFMLFSIYDQSGTCDLFFSYQTKADGWSKAINLGNTINTSGDDFAPSLTPDHKYLIYTNEGKLHWVSVELLETLKE
ncbi:MAG: hypothetical protein AAGH79_02440 [Bacteroidota bacterium]